MSPLLGVAVTITDGIMIEGEGVTRVAVGIDGHTVLVGEISFVTFLQSHGLLGLFRFMPLSSISSSKHIEKSLDK